jgi:8-hydroxy-5-deazaflavin:NADPH oxidoreductase
MRIAVLGTGTVGKALAERLAELGHDVAVGTRDVAAALARAEGTPPLNEWIDAHPDVRLATLAEAAAGAELIVNATSGQASLAALGSAGEQNLSGKVLLDVANPLDFSAGFPPTLTVKDTDSLGEQIQAAFPTTRVVKSLNTLTAALMVHPELAGDGDHTVFVSGNDPDAKSFVSDVLAAFGHRDVIDLGDITTSRGTEMYLALWIRMMMALGTGMFNVKVVR